MKIITFAGTKGGVGKSTLCFNVALEASQSHSVLMADLDPQQSLAEMWERNTDDLDNPRLVTGIGNVSAAVRLLKQHGEARDFLFVDTPGSNIPLIRDALIAADAIVLPVQPSPLDLLAQDAVCDLVAALRKTDRAIFVLNRVDGRSTLARESLVWLARNRTARVHEINQRTSYARASAVGKAASEIDKEAAREITALWNAIKELTS